MLPLVPWLQLPVAARQRSFKALHRITGRLQAGAKVQHLRVRSSFRSITAKDTELAKLWPPAEFSSVLRAASGEET